MAPDDRDLCQGSSWSGAGLAPGPRSDELDASELTGADQVDQDVPLVLLQDGRVRVLADADGIAVNDDFRAFRALRAERESFHRVSPPFVSMCEQTAAGRPFVVCQEARMSRSPASIASRSAAFCSISARTWTHGAAPARRSATMCRISARVSPSRRACPTKVSSAS